MNLLLDGGLIIGSFEYGIDKSIFDAVGYFYNLKIKSCYIDLVTGKSNRPIHMVEANCDEKNNIKKINKDYGLRSLVDCKEGIWISNEFTIINKVEGRYEKKV